MDACSPLAPTPRGHLQVLHPGQGMGMLPASRGQWVKHTKKMFHDISVMDASLCISCSLGLLHGAHLRAVLGHTPLHTPHQIQMPGSTLPLIGSLARKQNSFVLFPPNQLIPLSAKNNWNIWPGDPPSIDLNSGFLSRCLGFSFLTKAHHREDLSYLDFAFLDHKSLRVLDGARLSFHLQTSLLSSQGGHLLYGCVQPISDLNTVWCSESNSMQEARLYCFLLCSKTLKGKGIWICSKYT